MSDMIHDDDYIPLSDVRVRAHRAMRLRNGNPADDSKVSRMIHVGAMGRDGRRHKLRMVRFSGGNFTRIEWLDRFAEDLNREKGDDRPAGSQVNREAAAARMALA